VNEFCGVALKYDKDVRVYLQKLDSEWILDYICGQKQMMNQKVILWQVVRTFSRCFFNVYEQNGDLILKDEFEPGEVEIPVDSITLKTINDILYL